MDEARKAKGEFMGLAAIAIPVVANIWKLEEKNETGQLDVLVIGQQWTWSYHYDIDGDGFFLDVTGDGKVDEADQKWPLDDILDDDDVVTQNELVMPVGQQVDLTITSVTSSTPSGSPASTASATPFPASSAPGRSRPTSRASTPAGARSSAACPTPGCAWTPWC